MNIRMMTCRFGYTSSDWPDTGTEQSLAEHVDFRWIQEKSL